MGTLVACGLAALGCWWNLAGIRAVGALAEDFQQAIAQVAAAASQVAGASQSLAQGASEQAATLEQTSASSQEIATMAQQNTASTRSAAGLVAEAERAVDDAIKKLEQMVAAMMEINDSSSNIAKIIRVIEEIAFQTNILALNAAVEAARAGEAGMGFAVVADEVRNLAQRSAQAARDTAALIEESMARTSNGTARLDEVAAGVGVISEKASKVRQLVEGVNQGSQQQAEGLAQISRAVAEMEQVTQRNAASAEHTAAAAQELTTQAASLDMNSRQLRRILGIGG
jgi:methyl-accepting chemotaxis protein/methyl-accepting chemotaxis protein-1 (serine sensor receptor)